MRITRDHFKRVVAQRNPSNVAALRQAPNEYVSRVCGRALALLLDEKHVTCYEYVPNAEQAAKAHEYRQALRFIVKLTKSILDERGVLPPNAVKLPDEVVAPTPDECADVQVPDASEPHYDYDALIERDAAVMATGLVVA